jgi:sulfur carrier protein
MKGTLPPMIVTVNGKPQEVPDQTTVAELIRLVGLERAACAVEVNRELVPRKSHETARLSEGDHVELVTLVGGG